MSVDRLRDLADGDLDEILDRIVASKHGRATWVDDAMRAALRAVHDGVSVRGAVEGTDLTRGQVSRQAGRAAELVETVESDDGDEESDAGGGAGRIVAGGALDTDGDDDDGDAIWIDPAEVAAESFAEWLREMDDLVGINDRFANRLVRTVEDEGELPPPGRLRELLGSGGSGVRNSADIRWVGDMYVGWLEEYAEDATPHLRRALPPKPPQPQATPQPPQGGGDMEM